MRPVKPSPFARLLLVAVLSGAVAAHPAGAQSQARRSAPQAPAPRRISSTGLSWSSPVGTSQLGEALGGLLSRSVHSGRWGVIVISLSQGDTLFDYNADTALLPASTMKVFTSAMALDYLGPGHQFETQVLREGDVSPDGVLDGDLILRGAGDPSLGAPSGADPLRLLAHEVAAAGISKVNGAVIGDGTAFDGRHIPDGWLDRYLGASYAARVSALSYNENVARVGVRPVKGKAQVWVVPAISGLPVWNGVTVRAGSRSASIAVRQDPATGVFRVSGWIGANSPVRGYSLMVENPEMFVAAAFRAALVAEGVQVVGRRRVPGCHSVGDSRRGAPVANVVRPHHTNERREQQPLCRVALPERRGEHGHGGLGRYWKRNPALVPRDQGGHVHDGPVRRRWKRPFDARPGDAPFAGRCPRILVARAVGIGF